MSSRRGEAPTEELSWNAWVGRRPGEASPTGYPITTEAAAPRVEPGGPGGTPKQPGAHRNPVSTLRARFLRRGS
jgi:hypothetical protein